MMHRDNYLLLSTIVQTFITVEQLSGSFTQTFKHISDLRREKKGNSHFKKTSHIHKKATA